jgi:hypothetical protein
MDVASMSGLDWFFSLTLGIIYIALLFTVMVVTFRKGHWVLGLIGFFIPVLWLIGAILPSNAASSGYRAISRYSRPGRPPRSRRPAISPPRSSS